MTADIAIFETTMCPHGFKMFFLSRLGSLCLGFVQKALPEHVASIRNMGKHADPKVFHFARASQAPFLRKKADCLSADFYAQVFYVTVVVFAVLRVISAVFLKDTQLGEC